MMGDRHMAGGATAWLVVAPMAHIDARSTIAALPVAVFASLVPDVDNNRAKLGRNIIGRIVQRFTEHRVETHSVFTGLASAGVAGLLSGWVIAAAVATGWLIGHTFLDWNTRMGVALFWPFSEVKYRAPWAPLVKTNGPSEFVMITILGLALLSFLVWRMLS
jgi:inner membrane protein